MGLKFEDQGLKLTPITPLNFINGKMENSFYPKGQLSNTGV
jgi:hypothetical protein